MQNKGKSVRFAITMHNLSSLRETSSSSSTKLRDDAMAPIIGWRVPFWIFYYYYYLRRFATGPDEFSYLDGLQVRIRRELYNIIKDDRECVRLASLSRIVHCGHAWSVFVTKVAVRKFHRNMAMDILRLGRGNGYSTRELNKYVRNFKVASWNISI